MTVEKLITDHIDIWSSALQTRSTAGRGSSGKIDLYGIKKLRELILELAVRGKLVPQDPNDEPASELLKRIAAEKAELVKQGKIKKQKPLPEISEDDKPFELPEGWEWIRLGFITNYGECDKAEPADANAETWIVELEDIEKSTSKLLNRVRFFERPFKSSKNKFKKNDVLYGKLRPYLDKVLVADDSGVCTTEIIPIKAYGNILPSYLRLLLKSPRFITYANESTHGMNLPRLGTDKATHALVELTGIAEQVRIVNKVDELMSLCDQLEQQSISSLDAHQQMLETLLATLTNSPNAEELAENWARISQHFDTLFTTEASIDALKQTILQLAVMGKLVPQDPNDEPASELLKRIAVEKAELVKQGKIKKQKPLPEISEDEKPFELPNGWEWCRLPDLGELARGKSKHRPRNDPALYVDGKYPLVQTGDVSRSNGNIKTFTALYNELGVKQSRFWPKGTLCITIAANIADSGILKFDACFPDSVVGYSPFISEIPVKYFDFLMRTMKSSLEKYAPSTAQKNINLDILSQLFVPCPPLNEFERVVGKVEALFSLLDQLKSRLQSAQQTQLHLADALTDAALN